MTQKKSPARIFAYDSGRGLDIGWPVIPAEVRIENGRLLWRSPQTKSLRLRVRLLDWFCRLADGSDELIGQFAQKAGVLGICSHGLPRGGRATYFPPWHPVDCLPGYWWEPAHDPGQPTAAEWLWEPLAAWRHWARQARALLAIARQLEAGALGAPEHWRAVSEWGNEYSLQAAALWTVRVDQQSGAMVGLPTLDTPYATSASKQASSLGKRLDWERSRLRAWADNWVHLGGVTLALGWQTGPARPSVSITGSGLFGALAIQLVLAIGHSTTLAWCAGCNEPFGPRGSSGGGVRRWCEKSECKRAARAAASRDYRQTQKERGLPGGHADANADANLGEVGRSSAKRGAGKPRNSATK